MSEREWKFLINEMIHAANRVEEKIKPHTFNSFLEDEDAQDIVERRLQILSEAAGRLPDEIKQKYPDIPWKHIKGMRNVLAHEAYSINKQTDSRIIWDTATTIIPDFKEQLLEIYKE